jgi:hypothetical protein
MAKMAISSQKPCQVFFAELGKLFFGADLLEGPGMSAGSLLGLKLTSLRSQCDNGFVENADRYSGLLERLGTGRLGVKGGFEGRLFHGGDDARHKVSPQGRERLHPVEGTLDEYRGRP